MPRGKASAKTEEPVIALPVPLSSLQCSDCGNVPLSSEWPRQKGEEGYHVEGCDAFGPHSHHDTYVLYVFQAPSPPPMFRWDPKAKNGLQDLR
jgi:hypothetical protein